MLFPSNNLVLVQDPVFRKIPRNVELNTGRSDLRFCGRKFYRHALEHVQPYGAKCGTIFVFAPAGKKP